MKTFSLHMRPLTGDKTGVFRRADMKNETALSSEVLMGRTRATSGRHV